MKILGVFNKHTLSMRPIFHFKTEYQKVPKKAIK